MEVDANGDMYADIDSVSQNCTWNISWFVSDFEQLNIEDGGYSTVEGCFFII